MALAYQDRYAEAETSYRRAIELDPDNPLAHFNLGQALITDERYTEAEASYRRAIELDPDDPDARLNLGVALERQERYVEAEGAFRASVRRRDGDPLPEEHFNLGVVAGRLEQWEEAESRFREAEASGSSRASTSRALAGVYIQLAEKYQDHDYYQDALDEVRVALGEVASESESPSDVASLQLELGCVLARLGDLGRARAAFGKARSLAAPRSTVALAAQRYRRRLTRSPTEAPGWLPYLLVVVGVALIGASTTLAAAEILPTSEMTIIVLASLLVILGSFYLPGLTSLKLGGVELAKQPEMSVTPELVMPDAESLAQLPRAVGAGEFATKKADVKRDIVEPGSDRQLPPPEGE